MIEQILKDFKKKFGAFHKAPQKTSSDYSQFCKRFEAQEDFLRKALEKQEKELDKPKYFQPFQDDMFYQDGYSRHDDVG